MKFLELDNVELRNNYLEYLEEIKPKYPKRLYDIFVKAYRFHDYMVVGFNYYAETLFFKERSDKFVLILQSDILSEQRFVKIQFDLLQHVEFNSNTLDKDLSKFNLIGYVGNNSSNKGSSKFEIGRVYYAELGMKEQNVFTFELLTEEGFTLYLAFKKCRILENKLM